MQRLKTILTSKKDDKFGILFTKQGMMAYNGVVGINYSAKSFSAEMKKVITNHGDFYVPEGIEFFNTLSKLPKDISMNIVNKNGSELVIKYNNGKGKVVFPVELGGENSPHYSIPWLAWDKTAAENQQTIVSTAVGDDSWKNVFTLISKKGHKMYGDMAGLFLNEDKDGSIVIESFDFSVFLRSKTNKQPTVKKIESIKNIFVPANLCQLGFSGITDVSLVKDISDNDYIFFSGPNVQYFAMPAVDTGAFEQSQDIEKNFQSSTAIEAKITPSAAFLSMLNDTKDGYAKLSIKEGKLIFSHGRWDEEIGEVKEADTSFNVEVSLITRWLKDVQAANRKLSTGKNSFGEKVYYLAGNTWSGCAFFAELTEESEPIMMTSDDDKPEEVVDSVVEDKPEEELTIGGVFG